MGLKNALIITYYNAPNYGAFLQAYSTQEFLKSNGINANILEHKANKPGLLTKLLDKRADASIIEYRNLLQAEIDKVQNNFDFAKQGLKYDVAVIGSDEIWNVKNLTARHLTVFFKPYKNAKTTVAYSACAGKCAVKHMKLFPYTKGITSLDAVAVRDEHTEHLAKAMGVKDVKRTLDPTFLNNFTKDIPERQMEEDYLLVYTYGLSAESIESVKEFASKNGLKVVATGSNCEWADYNPMVSPFEWLSLIKYSKFVVTSTFHGSVFSIILEKQFAVVDTESNKVNSLLEELGLTDRKNNDIFKILAEEIDYDAVNITVDKRRRESANYLLSFFKGE